jgi:hypothetical protein
MIEIYRIIRKFLLNLFYREINYPSVTGGFICRRNDVGKPRIIYADQLFKLSRELNTLTHSDLRSAEVYASNKGDIYVYSFIAPARYGIRKWYAGIIGFIAFFLQPIQWIIDFFKLIGSLLFSLLDFVFELIKKLVPIVISIIGLLVLLFFVALIVKIFI